MNHQLVEKHIRTKNKIRKIVTYVDDSCELRKYHEIIVKTLRKSCYPSLFAKAYVPNRGIFENAKAHLYNDIFLKFDVKDFFNSIDHEILVEQLHQEMNKVSEISLEVCEHIVSMCHCDYPGLPLGLVTSPDLANIYLKRFDSQLYGNLKLMQLDNVIYTRYADDLIISFKYPVGYDGKLFSHNASRKKFSIDAVEAGLSETIKEIEELVKNLLERYRLELNEKKTAIYSLRDTNHVRITGISITVDENGYRRISVGKKLKNEVFWKAINLYDSADRLQRSEEIQYLKGMISFMCSIEKTGFEDAYSINMMKLIEDRGFSSLQELIAHLDRDEVENETAMTTSAFDKDALKKIAFRLDKDQNYELAYYYFKLLAGYGDKDALFYVAYYNDKCRIKKSDIHVAIKYYTKASRAGHKVAAKNLAMILEKQPVYSVYYDLGHVEEVYKNAIKENEKALYQYALFLLYKPQPDEKRGMAYMMKAKNAQVKEAIRYLNDSGYRLRVKETYQNNGMLQIEEKVQNNRYKLKNHIPIKVADFVVRYDYNYCVSNDHPLEKINAKVSVFNLHEAVKEVEVDARYCPHCNIYYISESEYQRLQKLGTLCCQLFTQTEYIEYKKLMNTGNMIDNRREKSILNQYGYNAGKNNGLTSADRQAILLFVIDNGIMSEDHVRSFLRDYLIPNPNRNYDKARLLWREDLAFLENLDQWEDRRKVLVNSIYRRERVWHGFS